MGSLTRSNTKIAGPDAPEAETSSSVSHDAPRGNACCETAAPAAIALPAHAGSVAGLAGLAGSGTRDRLVENARDDGVGTGSESESMRPGRSADEINVVGRQFRVRARQSQMFAARLRDQHAVERVGVMKRQRRRGLRMGPGDRQLAAACIHGDVEKFPGHVELAERVLDPDLPHARCRDVEFSFGNRPRLGLRQTWIVQDRPKQDMGVEQQSHSGRGAPLKHLRDLGIALEHIVGERERPLHGADQRATDRTIGADDPSDRTTVSGQFDRLSRLGATYELGELRLGFGNGDLHLYIPSVLTNI